MQVQLANFTLDIKKISRLASADRSTGKRNKKETAGSLQSTII